jgi:hypothetical protein
MKGFTNEDIIEFVKTTTSTDQFSQNEYPRELIDQMKCYTYQDWCKMISELNGFPYTMLIRRFFNFEAFLIHEWDFSKAEGCEDYYLVARKNDQQLKLLESADEFNNQCGIIWIVMIPTH